MTVSDALAAAEAYELHDFLTEHGIPLKVFSEENGTLMDSEGRHFYYLPLQDRVMMFVERFSNPKLMESQVKWTPWQPKDSLQPNVE